MTLNEGPVYGPPVVVFVGWAFYVCCSREQLRTRNQGLNTFYDKPTGDRLTRVTILEVTTLIPRLYIFIIYNKTHDHTCNLINNVLAFFNLA